MLYLGGCIFHRSCEILVNMRLISFFYTLVFGALTVGLSSQVHAQHLARKSISPGDQLTVTVFGQPELSIDAQVDLTGGFSVPVLGRIETSGKTITDVHKVVNERLKEFYTNAEAIVFFSGYSDFTMVTVSGEVQTPGVIFFGDGEWPNVLAAIAHAGGSIEANPMIKVTRNNRTIFEGPLRSISDGYKGRITIQANDLIFVE